jgi:hypothetical protein
MCVSRFEFHLHCNGREVQPRGLKPDPPVRWFVCSIELVPSLSKYIVTKPRSSSSAWHTARRQTFRKPVWRGDTHQHATYPKAHGQNTSKELKHQLDQAYPTSVVPIRLNMKGGGRMGLMTSVTLPMGVNLRSIYTFTAEGSRFAQR